MIIKRNIVIPELKTYIDKKIIPRYRKFDLAHNEDHVKYVIKQCIKLAKLYNVDLNMSYTIGAYHDLGLGKGREGHEKESAKILREDKNLKKWFNKDQIQIMADAVEDHRASLEYEPRSIYGKIVSDADRVLDPEITIKRAINFGLVNFPNYTKEEHFNRVYNYLLSKYSETGYAKFWLNKSDSFKKLEEFRKILRDKKKFLDIFNEIWEDSQ